MSATAQIRANPTPESSPTPVYSRLLQRKCACGGTPGPSGECAECRRKRLGLQRRATKPAEPPSVPPIVHEVLRSPGQSLTPATRAFMEPRFGHDFGAVRVHADAKAAESARAVNALAYAVGQNVVFGTGQYAPETSEGRKLLAHELAHTVQQANTAVPERAGLAWGAPRDGWEGEAERIAASVGRAQHPAAGAFEISSMPTRRLQSQDAGTSSATAPSATATKTYSFSVTTSGCKTSPFVEATVLAAARAAFDKVQTSACVHSAGLKDKILSEFDGLNIDCEQGNEDSPCGRASRYFTQTVNIYPPALNPAKCGSLASTILHEVVHLTEWGLFGHGELADACEASCFGYGSGDPTKCK